MVLVSVVIPVYNPREDWLSEAVRSALSQAPVQMEVLVIDDGSAHPVAFEHGSVRVVRQKNGGVAAARNRGLREARGDLVAFLDQDDYWLPGKLAAQVGLMERGVGLCSSGFDLLVDGERRPGWGSGATGYRDLLAGNGICASTVVADRLLVLQVGGFDTKISKTDDWDLWLRLARVAEVRHVEGAFAVYRTHDSMTSRDYRSMWWGSIRVLWRHRRAVPLRGVRRQGQIYGAQAFDAFRSTRAPSHLLWASVLWPSYVTRQVMSRIRSRG